jgi:hypothetical protein
MGSQRKFAQNTIAIVYDFDGTLCPQPMQEYTVLSSLGVDPKEFWKEVAKEAKETESEPMLVYMRLLLEKAEVEKAHIGRWMWIGIINALFRQTTMYRAGAESSIFWVFSQKSGHCALSNGVNTGGIRRNGAKN